MGLADLIKKIFGVKERGYNKTAGRFVSLKGADTFLKRIGTIGVWSEDDKGIYDKYEINQKEAERLISETLNGKWNKLVMELEFIDEGTMIKRLDKVVNKEWTDCVVLHNMDKGMALIYVSSSKLRCYELIADQRMYSSEDVSKIREISFENARLPEYIVHKSSLAIQRGLWNIIDNIENIDEALDESENWATTRTTGKNGFMKTCIKLGAVKG